MTGASAAAVDWAAALQLGPLDDPTVVEQASRLLGFALLAFGAAVGVALLYRWYTRERIPPGVTALVGVAVVGLSLQTFGLFTAVLGGTETDLFELDTVLRNLAALALAGLASPVGRLVGDRMATDVFAFAGARELDAEVSRLVRHVGRVTTVELPDADDIGDIEGYDPVPAAVKAEIGEKVLLFPRRLSVAELGDRVATRLKDDHGVGHVDVDLAPDGEVRYLGLGSRAAGIGPTLAPGTVAVAVRADPPSGASAGDVVQVWDVPEAATDGPGDGTGAPAGGDAPAASGARAAGETGVPHGDGATDGGATGGSASDGGAAGGGAPAPRRVTTAELRAAAEDVVTLALDEPDARKLDPARRYRLVTLPAEPQADREFASLLRAADETMGVVEVAPGSAAVGATIGSLDVTVAAVSPAGETVEAIPARSRALAAGDTLYVVARPDALRRLEDRAGAATERADD